MKKDAEVERSQIPDTKHQKALKMVEEFLKTIPYLVVKLSKDDVAREFGDEWENVREVLEVQNVIVTRCKVYECKKHKIPFMDVLEEKIGYKFQPRLDKERKIINPILRERYNLARARADELAPDGWFVWANLKESDAPRVLGQEWRIVLCILKDERKCVIKRYKVWKKYGFLNLKKEFVDWKYLITSSEPENATNS